MSRPKGSKNKPKPAVVETFSYTTEQRIQLLADLLVERIVEDQRNGHHLLELLGGQHAAQQ